MDEMLKKQDVLDAILAKIDKLEKTNTSADVILGLAAAMSVVKKMGKLEQEPCDDAISRQAVLEIIRKCHCEEWVKADIGAPIEALQPVTPAEKVGRWIIKMRVNKKIMVAGGKKWYIQIMCDKCGFIKTIMEKYKGQYKFCPNCGQPKMQEVEE